MKILSFLLGLSVLWIAPAWSQARPEAREAFQKGFKAQIAGDLDTAEKYYQETIKRDPNYAMTYYNLGIIMRKRNKLADAEKFYRKSIELDPNYADSYYNLGNMILFSQQRLNEAESLFKKAIALDPKQSDYFLDMGNVMWYRKQWKEAIKYYKKALELNPNNKDAKTNLNRLQ